jgi:hypothetical protein
MPKPMYVWSGSAWVSVASEVESLATYATQSYASAQPGMKMVVPTSVAVGSGSGSVDTNGAVTFSGASSVSLNGCFNSSYDNYRIVFTNTNASNAIFNMRMRASGTDNSTASSYGTNYTYVALSGGAAAGNGYNNGTSWALDGSSNYYNSNGHIDTFRPFQTEMTRINFSHTGLDGANYYNWTGGGNHTQTVSYDGFTIYPTSSTISGTIRVYGYKN